MSQPVRRHYRGSEVPTLDDLLTIAEAAEMLRMPFDSLRYRMYTGDAPVSVKIGKRRLFRRSDVLAWIEAKYAEQVS